MFHERWRNADMLRAGSYTYTLHGVRYWQDDLPLHINREREAFTLPLHRHDFVEIQYVAEGSGFHYIGDCCLRAERGDVYIIPIGTAHVYRPHSQSKRDELIVYNCIFAPALLRRQSINAAFALPDGARRLIEGSKVDEGNEAESKVDENEVGSTVVRNGGAFHALRDEDGTVRQCIMQLFSEYQARNVGYECVAIGLLERLLVTLYRLQSSSDTEERSLPLTAGRLDHVFAHIHRHFAEPLTIGELAALVPVSPSYLQRLFKEATGQSVTEYVQNVRMQICSELLRDTRLTVKDVAARVGYRDMKHFHRLFRQKTGRTPSEYRRRAGGARPPST